MAGAIIPLTVSLLPVILPEVKSFIQLVEGAFHKNIPPPPPDTSLPPVKQGPAKMDTVIQLVSSLLTSLQGSGTVLPPKDSLQGFIEGIFQILKQGGELGMTVPDPSPPPDPGAFKGTILNMGSTSPSLDISRSVLKLNGTAVLVTP
jgi:hypothetical protein